ncbi:receptor-like protein EIX1 [Glycine soja]|uniref:Receptor-like protein EIX2 n=1 Tax=Glycine soja TaxID=3848 RepID=A0A445GJR8_GLYSO|nr:receptor-like protein EIX1 [Glycine soja]RZB61469.1 Receptor-like protein EIX2 [Glycine soja]
MGGYFLKILFSLLVCFLHTEISILGLNSTSEISRVKCIESERQALLNFKRGLVNDSGMLSTWRDDENNRGCCKWKGLQCNNETGHVSKLDLHGHYPQRLSGVINISSLIDLQNIEYLNLSNNDFEGSYIPKFMGSFTNLKYLDLSRSRFGGRIPYELGNLSKLEYLDLKWNSLDGAIPSQLGKLTSLQHLDLSLNSLSGEIPSEVGVLTSLQHLDLSRNSLRGEIPSEVGKLTSLRHLDLSFNSFRGEIHSEVGMLTSLQHLDLSGNSLLGEIPSEVGKLTALRYLDLSYNVAIHGEIPYHFKNLSQLQYLCLRGLNLSGPIPLRVGNLPILHTLRLEGNFDLKINDAKWLSSLSFLTTLDLTSLHNLGSSRYWQQMIGELITNLRELSLVDCNLTDESVVLSASIQNSSSPLVTLNLNDNSLEGPIPNLSNFTSLRTLHLSNNGLLHELESLHLQDNYLEGDINEWHLNNLSKLEELDLTDNSLSLKFGTTWVPPFQLYNLGLASCKLCPSFPSWLQTQSHLGFLDISDAGIDDFVPDWFWNKLQSISLMNMSYNTLKGTIPNLPIKLTDDYKLIILNSNQLEGEIPAFLSHAYALDFSNNKISGLNTFLCGKRASTNLHTLDLSSNRIMGQLPNCWEHLNTLEFLDLSNNKLSGKIPQSMGTLVNLEALALRHNNFIGDLPFTLKNCTRLDILDLSENLLSGPIPSWIGQSLQQLQILSLRVNHFNGSVPVHLCYLRQIHILDLSRNNLSKGIPTCLRNFTAMMESRVITSQIVRGRRISSRSISPLIYDSNVLLMWKGQDHMYWNPENLLKSIDLSSNHLTGEVPKELGYLLGLVSLNLSRNNLHGQIPSEIGNLNSLEFLDLSRNHISRKIPSTLSKIDRLAVLDLSNNDLNGRIPWGRQLQTFDGSSFEGNTNLCGQQLNKSCPGDKPIGTPEGEAVDGEDEDSIFYGALYMSLGLGFFTGFWGLLGPILLWKPWRIAYQRFLIRLTDYILLMVEVNMAKCHMWFKG